MEIAEFLPVRSRSIALRVALITVSLCSVALVAVGQLGRGQSVVVAILLGLLAVVGLHVLIGYSSFLTKWLLRDWPTRVRGSGWRALRVASIESAWMARLYLIDQPWMRSALRWPAVQTRAPIVLVHGFWCNGAVWRSLLRRWPDADRALIAVSLEPSYRSFSRQLDTLVEALSAICAASGQDRVVLVGHSMGGLLARAVADRHPERVSGVVTVAAPHRGTWFGELIYGREYGPPSPRARWLKSYNDTSFERCLAPTRSLWTADDNIVIPAEHSRLAGGHNLELRDCGHLAAICTPPGIAAIAAAVLELDQNASTLGGSAQGGPQR